MTLLPAVPTAPREFRGVWVATVANIDFPSAKNLSVKDQIQELQVIVDTVAKCHLNAIVFQVRPSGDAVYASKIEPWSEFMGTSRPAGWDPFEKLIELAHKQGIEVHAWLNPFRARHSMMTEALRPGHLGLQSPETLISYGNQLWFNPSDPKVQSRAITVIKDIVQRYDLDGVHIDDYFYPYPLKLDRKRIPFDDSKSYDAYRKNGGKSSLTAWRRSQVNTFIKNAYFSVKKLKNWVRVGFSPFGIYRPNVPTGIVAGLDAYEDLAADAVAWLKQGWCDYLAPQLYWKIDSPGQPFLPLLKWWQSKNTAKKAIWPGIYSGRIAPDNGNWNPSEIVNQVTLSRKNKTGGAIFFSAKVIVKDIKQNQSKLFLKLYPTPALSPPIPNTPKMLCEPPRVRQLADSVEYSTTQKSIRFIAIYSLEKGKWILQRITSDPTGIVPFAGSEALAFSAISRSGQESPRTVVLPSPSAEKP